MALIQADFFSEALMRTVTIQAVIPVDKISEPGTKKREKKPFKTLYLLHGIYGNYTDWVTGTRIMRWAQDRNLAVVLPSGENHFYIDCEKSNEFYGKFIGEELVRVTRELFPLSDKREDTFIAGLSMGGYGAVRNGLKYHHTFGCIAGLSSAFILEKALRSEEGENNPLIERRSYYESVFGDLSRLRGSDKDYKALALRLKKEGAKIPKIYLACGLDDFLLQENLDYRDFLEKNEIEVTFETGPGNHEWDFWDTYMKKVLDWLPLEEKSEGISSGNVK